MFFVDSKCIIYLAVDHNKYGFRDLGEDTQKIFKDEKAKWFVGYYEALKKDMANGRPRWQTALPVITRAAQSPLYLAPEIVKHTLGVYMEYIAKLDSSIKPPKLPIDGSRWAMTSLVVFDQRVTVKTSDEQAERLALTKILTGLEQRVVLLEKDNKPSQNTKDIARKLFRQIFISNDLNVGNVK